MKNDWVRRTTTTTTTLTGYFIVVFFYFQIFLTLALVSQTGGAVITTVSQTGSLFVPKSVYLPHELLGEVSADVIIVMSSERARTVDQF